MVAPTRMRGDYAAQDEQETATDHGNEPAHSLFAATMLEGSIAKLANGSGGPTTALACPSAAGSQA